MALTRANFYTLVNGAAQHHTYRSADTAAACVAADYFNEITNDLKQYDVINIISDTGTTPALTAVIVTSATGAASVTVAAATA